MEKEKQYILCNTAKELSDLALQDPHEIYRCENVYYLEDGSTVSCGATFTGKKRDLTIWQRLRGVESVYICGDNLEQAACSRVEALYEIDSRYTD